MTKIKWPKRRSIRLTAYNYSSPGGYFITVNAHQHQCLFGQYQPQWQLNAAGYMVDTQWRMVIERFSPLELDAYIVMPNHFHAIVTINDTSSNQKISLSQIIQLFKVATTQAYRKGICEQGWRPYSGRLWQRNYYEHIINNETTWQHCRAYIFANPDQSHH